MNENITCHKAFDLAGGQWEHTLEMRRRVYFIDGLCPTLTSSMYDDFDKAIKIVVVEDE